MSRVSELVAFPDTTTESRAADGWLRIDRKHCASQFSRPLTVGITRETCDSGERVPVTALPYNLFEVAHRDRSVPRSYIRSSESEPK